MGSGRPWLRTLSARCLHTSHFNTSIQVFRFFLQTGARKNGLCFAVFPITLLKHFYALNQNSNTWNLLCFSIIKSEFTNSEVRKLSTKLVASVGATRIGPRLPIRVAARCSVFALDLHGFCRRFARNLFCKDTFGGNHFIGNCHDRDETQMFSRELAG